jgi:pimeloyl-ACP methyl ester carboxylesterase
MQQPTIVTVPCFSGAPWDLDSLAPLSHRPSRTMCLPDDLDDIEAYADFVEPQVSDVDDYVLVGDSFGAVVALAVALRQPPGLGGLVMSGGFAANPVVSRLGRAKIAGARFLPGPLYRHLTLRLHASALASPHDGEGQVVLDRHDFRQLFIDNTPWHAYVARAKAAFSADYRSQLSRVDAPTLIITPSHDELIGPEAAQTMLDGIPDAVEVVLERTGHMFRFTHPHTYATAVEEFIAANVAKPMKPVTPARRAVAPLPVG